MDFLQPVNSWREIFLLARTDWYEILLLAIGMAMGMLSYIVFPKLCEQ